MAATALSDVLSSKQFYRKNPSETSVNSIEQGLPAVINDLNQGGDYWRNAKANRYRKLIREGHLNDLLELAALAPKMAKRSTPAHWFAAVASKANWERTLKFLTKLREVARLAEDVAKRVQARAQDMGAVLKAVWRHKERAVQMAVTASETAVNKKRPDGSPFKLFMHLALKQGNNPTTA
ncbi:hypothetical protein [Streptomyces sp. NPDC048341]|uniref:hypothetical protein n=1 Tax=Streptomyces sp. NPDC048341 TaxID=3154620 RepID=UPI003415F59F